MRTTKHYTTELEVYFPISFWVFCTISVSVSSRLDKQGNKQVITSYGALISEFLLYKWLLGHFGFHGKHKGNKGVTRVYLL